MGEQTMRNPRIDKDGNMIHDDLTVYIAVGHPATRPEILRSLVSASNDSVRERLAENTNLPADCLVELAADATPSVRLAVAEKSKTPQSILNALCSDESPDVRFGMASNSHMPMEILQRLWKDKNPYVATRADRTLRLVNASKGSQAVVISGWFGQLNQLHSKKRVMGG
jgi:hypothetical protein